MISNRHEQFIFTVILGLSFTLTDILVFELWFKNTVWDFLWVILVRDFWGFISSLRDFFGF